MTTPEEATKKMEDTLRRDVEKMDLSLYKRFGYPKVEELGIEYKTFDLESLGEMYTIEKYQFSDINRQYREISGNAVMLFNRQDIVKMYESGVGAVEFMITNEKGMLLVLHYRYADPEDWDRLDQV